MTISTLQTSVASVLIFPVRFGVESISFTVQDNNIEEFDKYDSVHFTVIGWLEMLTYFTVISRIHISFYLGFIKGMYLKHSVDVHFDI